MRTALALLAFLCALPATTSSQIPLSFSYQGYLEADGSPVPDGNYDLEFVISDGWGEELWRQTYTDMPVSRGMFDVILTIPSHLAFDEPYLLWISVNDEWMEQPTEILGSPYCFNARRLQGLNSEAFLRRDTGESSTGSAANELLRIENTGAGRGMTVISSASHGLYGKTISGSAYAGVEGEGAAGGPGVRGSSSANHGTIGYTEAADKAGIFGNSPNRIGVWGNSVSGTGVYGLSETGYAINGESGQNHGVRGLTRATNEWVPAIYGRNEGSGDGVYGWSQDRHGVFGVTTSTWGTDAGVYGKNDNGGPAIMSDGPLHVDGGDVVVTNGDLHVEGEFRGNFGVNGGAPFPRPAYDSGWVVAAAGATVPLGTSQHLPTGTYPQNNIVVDVMIKDHIGISHADYPSGFVLFPDNDIEVYVSSDHTGASHIRVRMWYYP